MTALAEETTVPPGTPSGTDARRSGGPSFLLRRALHGVLVVLAAYSLTFVILWALPSDAAEIMANSTSEQATADPEQIQALRERYHLDDPLPVQYLRSLGNLVTLDWGTSIQTGEPVTEAVADALPHTAALSALALLIAVPVGTAVAVLGTVSPHRLVRRLLDALPPLGVSIPTFWIGLVLLQLLSFRMHLFPAFGNQGFTSLVLPAVTLSIPVSASIAQVLGRSLATTWEAPFIRAVRARGLGRRGLVLRHALQNAALPALTMTGLILGNLLAGSVVTETVFARDGIGRLAQQGVSTQDIPVVQAVTTVAALVFVLASFAVDVLYRYVDPRIQGGGR